MSRPSRSSRETQTSLNRPWRASAMSRPPCGRSIRGTVPDRPSSAYSSTTWMPGSCSRRRRISHGLSLDGAALRLVLAGDPEVDSHPSSPRDGTQCSPRSHGPGTTRGRPRTTRSAACIASRSVSHVRSIWSGFASGQPRLRRDARRSGSCGPTYGAGQLVGIHKLDRGSRLGGISVAFP